MILIAMVQPAQSDPFLARRYRNGCLLLAYGQPEGSFLIAPLDARNRGKIPLTGSLHCVSLSRRVPLAVGTMWIATPLTPRGFEGEF